MLYTKNCVVTGKPATIWTGHVKLNRCFINNGHYENICVIAGFVDNEICNEAEMNQDGCFGDYKSEYKIIVRGE